MRTLHAFIFLLLSPALAAQEPVIVTVDSTTKLGPVKPIWNYFGYDEPNYTYMKNGKKLVAELTATGPGPVFFRAHSLLVSGDGKPALKWGSTNAYTEGAAGNSVYDWTIVDRIFDTYREARGKPFVEIGFMPEALSSQPQPYRHKWPDGSISTGWAFPPKDYDRWRELIYQWTKHCVERYGKAEVETWYWEVWNEPDILYWRGTPEEYNKLYDFAVDGVKRALPTARVGGPATTGPANPKAAAFLQQFLQHCLNGKNEATGKAGSPLDFVTYHAKGRPTVVDDHVRMGLSKNLQDVASGMEILNAFPKFRKLPIILSESDPEGCAACSARVYPQNAYRNGTLYPTYTAAAINNTLKLADRHRSNIAGLLTWAFEFEDQPYFDGFRTLATNGIDKPVLNVFRMAAMMSGNRVRTESTGAAGLDAILKDGVTAKPDVDAFASRGPHDVTVMLWNYHDDDMPAPDASVKLTIAGLPKQVQVRHYRIDATHSNAYTVWKNMGSPQSPNEEQYKQLEAAGQLQLLQPSQPVSTQAGKAALEFLLPRQAVSLVQLTW
ncbi:MAG: beta-xylosidase [Bryobacteraceae bacterium]